MPPSRHLQDLHKYSKLIGTEAYEEKEAFVELLGRIASVVREAKAARVSNVQQIVEKAEEVFNEAIIWAYTDGDYDFLPSFAHSPSAPPAKDSSMISIPGVGDVPPDVLSVLDRMRAIFGYGGPSPFDAMIDAQRPKPWPETPHPHPKTTRLSRFREGITPSATEATPVARMVYQARCEVAADSIPCPVSAAISTDSSTLALVSQGGWKNRDPVLTLYFLDEEAGTNNEGGGRISDYGGFRYMSLEPGLSEVAHDVAIDSTHKLALIADSYRIKSFSWGEDVTFGGWKPARGKNVHTMDSGKYSGPIAALPGGRIVRAGKGGAAIWNVDALETHKGGRRVGRGKFSVEDSWRDNDCGEIERSTGSAPSTTVTFAQAGLQPATWHLHIPSGNLLCAEDGRNGHRYACYALDLEAGGTAATRFLGHGGNVTAFSTSAGDANVFVSACADGYARLYDVRHPLPVMTIDSGKSSEFCFAAELAHPDGIPTVFTGGDRQQNVQTWDVRARALVYELATGNTGVRTLAWDARHAALYAGGECDYMDRLGNTHDYRAARIPRWADQDPEARIEHQDGDEDEDVDMEEDEEDEYDEDEDDEWDRCWPKRAAHDEKAFGYAYDAGEHVLLRYQFKEDPDTTVLPDYGQAQLDRYNDW